MIRGQNGEACNIGMDQPEVRTRELAKRTVRKAKELFDYRGTATFGKSSDKEYLTDNPNRRCPIIDKARDHLDYDPSIDLEEGLKRSLIWYSENQEAEDA
jgi:nucleoside-diphosphate-sugar epimerase